MLDKASVKSSYSSGIKEYFHKIKHDWLNVFNKNNHNTYPSRFQNYTLPKIKTFALIDVDIQIDKWLYNKCQEFLTNLSLFKEHDNIIDKPLEFEQSTEVNHSKSDTAEAAT